MYSSGRYKMSELIYHNKCIKNSRLPNSANINRNTVLWFEYIKDICNNMDLFVIRFPCRTLSDDFSFAVKAPGGAKIKILKRSTELALVCPIF